MNIRSILIWVFLSITMACGDTYRYPEGKRPSVSLKEACGIAETILAKLGLEKDYYVLEVTILGNKQQTGAGTWTLWYRNTQGDKAQISIYFPEDYCFVMMTSKAGGFSQKGYTRDGRVSPRWLEEQEQIRKEEEEHDREFGSGESDSAQATKETEQPGADQPATKPADKAPVKDQPPTPTSKDAPR